MLWVIQASIIVWIESLICREWEELKVRF
jgi:hypothetical protein